MNVEENLKEAVKGKTLIAVNGYSFYFIFLDFAGLDKVRAKPNNHLTHAEYEFPFYKITEVQI